MNTVIIDKTTSFEARVPFLEYLAKNGLRVELTNDSCEYTATLIGAKECSPECLWDFTAKSTIKEMAITNLAKACSGKYYCTKWFWEIPRGGVKRFPFFST